MYLDGDEDDYLFYPKWKKILLKITPKSLILKWNLFSYKHDSVIFAIENKIEAFKDTIRPEFYYKAINWYQENLGGACGRVKNSWEYAKLGWSNFDYDYTFFLKLMKFKLERMEKNIRENDRHVGSEVWSGQIKLVTECLGRLIDNNYNVMAYEEINKHFPDRRIDIFESTKREVHLTSSGKKVVMYSTEHKEMPDDYYVMQKRLNDYYSDLLVADMRVMFHIMLPMNSKEKEERDGEYHYGLLQWWD